jgi:hypothetical protein
VALGLARGLVAGCSNLEEPGSKQQDSCQMKGKMLY